MNIPQKIKDLEQNFLPYFENLNVQYIAEIDKITEYPSEPTLKVLIYEGNVYALGFYNLDENLYKIITAYRDFFQTISLLFFYKVIVSQKISFAIPDDNEVDSIYFESSKIEDIAFFEKIKKLIFLSLVKTSVDWNLFEKYSFPKLKILDLSYNSLEKIDFLKNLISVEELDLSHNELSDISPLKNLVNLKTLKLSYNKITNPLPLKSLAKLETLLLDNNPLEDASALGDLLSLKVLDLRNTFIKSVDFAKKIQLKEFYFPEIEDNNTVEPEEEKIEELEQENIEPAFDDEKDDKSEKHNQPLIDVDFSDIDFNPKRVKKEILQEISQQKSEIYKQLALIRQQAKEFWM